MVGFCIKGPLAHLVERTHGMGKVAGSSPAWSTKIQPPEGGFDFCRTPSRARCNTKIRSELASEPSRPFC